MRTLIILAALAAGGYYGFKAVMAKSEALIVFEKFMAEQSNGNCREMKNLVEEGGTAQAYVDKLCTPVTVTAFGVTGGQSAAGMIADMNSTPAGAMRTTVYKVEQETKAAGGTEVTMTVKASVRGRASAMNPLPPPVHYTVKAKKSGEAWKLVDLSE